MLHLLLLLATLIYGDKIVSVGATYNFSAGYSYDVAYIYKPDYLTGLGLSVRKYDSNVQVVPIVAGYIRNVYVTCMPSLKVWPDLGFVFSGTIGYRIGKEIRIVPNASGYWGFGGSAYGVGVSLEFNK